MIKDLFIKYMQGNCTEDEFEQFLMWIREGSLNNSSREVIMELWNKFESDTIAFDQNRYNQMLDKIHHQINVKQNSKHFIIQKSSSKTRILSLLTRVAAILLLPVLSLLIYTTSSKKEIYMENLNDLEVEAPAGSRIHFKLSDGTNVWLNHGSKLKYPYKFNGKERNVSLTGEAYFEVAHNKDVPFIVQTNHLDVKATGTAFNVSAYSWDDLVNTTLVEGRVILYEKINNREIRVLHPDQCLKFNSQKRNYILESENTKKYVAWKNGQLVFKNDRITDVAEKLADWYNVEVEISNEKVKAFTFTATFTDETLSQTLDLLSLATQVSYKLTQSKKLPDGSFSKQKVVIGLK